MGAEITPVIFLVVILISLLASILSFYSGFGLGTILLPVFAIWFPLKEAIIMTAVVHLFNNLFKLMLLRQQIDRDILLRFGIPALIAAVVGSLALNFIGQVNIAYPIRIGPFLGSLRLINVIVGLSILIFGIIEFVGMNKSSAGKKSLILGGILSGFFGGLSGHQGVLRSMFLLQYPLSKEAFIATGVGIACCIDVARLTVYSTDLIHTDWENSYILVGTSITAAILGALVGNYYLKKVDIGWIKKITALGIIIMGLAILLGII